MSVEVGTHRNGERFAKVWLSDHGINATVEGVGVDDDAVGHLSTVSPFNLRFHLPFHPLLRMP